MKIKAVRPFIQKLPLVKPYTIAYDTFSDVELVFLEITLENGVVGLGSGSPAEEVIGENAQQTLQNLQSGFVEAFVGRDIRHFQQIIFETYRAFPQMAGTQAAVDIALHDAFCKHLGISVVSFYGQKIASLPTSVTIGIKDVAETLAEAADYLQLGFNTLKIKTGRNVEQDIERIAKLRETHGNHLHLHLRVDANQGYTASDLLRFHQATQHLNVALIEQPLPVGQESALLAMPPDLRARLAADESLKDAEYALRFAQEPKPFGIYNIKLMKCGGILAAKAIATIAQHADIPLFWGCNDESRISIAAALHAAYSCPNTRFLDLDGSFDLAEDLVEGGFKVVDGYLEIDARKAGLGILDFRF